MKSILPVSSYREDLRSRPIWTSLVPGAFFGFAMTIFFAVTQRPVEPVPLMVTFVFMSIGFGLAMRVAMRNVTIATIEAADRAPTPMGLSGATSRLFAWHIEGARITFGALYFGPQSIMFVGPKTALDIGPMSTAQFQAVPGNSRFADVVRFGGQPLLRISSPEKTNLFFVPRAETLATALAKARPA